MGLGFFVFFILYFLARVEVTSVLILTEKKGIRCLKHISLLKSHRAPKIKF